MSRLYNLLAVAVVGVLLIGAPPALGQEREVPDLIYSPYDPEVALWVSADEALASSGELRSDQLGILRLKWKARSDRGDIAKEGCYTEGMVLVDPLPHMVPVRTLEALNDFSLSVVYGKVAGTEPGFFEQQPGALVRLEPIEVVAGDATTESGPLFIYYPNARFDVGPYSFCKSDPRLPHEPQVGDRLLVFVRTGAMGARERLISPLPDDVFVETKQGELLTPGALRDDPVVVAARTLEDVVEALPSAEDEQR